MASGVEELLSMLFEMIDEAKNAPFSGEKCVIDRDKALDLLDEIRAKFPVELAEAKKVVSARSEYLAAARREAEEIRRRAEEQAKQMVASEQVMTVARQRGNEMLRKAEERAKELRRAANEYCEDVLRRTEEAMSEAYDELRRSRAKFRAAAGSATAPQPQNPSGRAPYDAEADQ